ncbi:MAG: 2OG-Fe(II) oxygenase [Lewinellaceae bacterium]|nr:2OG-Fe(II) oxygenase [Saprospiraceae bacterium]MCB9330574.1 2OG-Fe(II) oxygenase [Lewinellaceae bacterium]
MEDKFEVLIEGLLEHQYGNADTFIGPELTASLRQQLESVYEAGIMKPAGIGQHFSYEKNLKIRGDLIYWLEKEHSAAEKAFLEHIEAFIDHLNRTCYTGINAYEFHFARYEAGSFYKRHLDQFKSDQGRKYSLVTYLNENWEPKDAGQLLLFSEANPVEIFPTGGRAVFFKSDEIEHEVKAGNRARMSIAGWLKRV